MSGGLMQLVAYGAQDVYLTGNPQITLFKVVYRRHTNFSIECIELPLDTAKPGGRPTVQVLRNGDLASRAYLRVTLPELRPSNATADLTDGAAGFSGNVAWVRRLGHALIKSVELQIGGSSIDKHYGIWLDIFYELVHTTSLERGYKQMIGDIDILTVPQQAATGIKEGTVLFVPLQFWFCRNYGQALPLIALQYHEVRLNFELEQLDRLMVYTRGSGTQKAPTFQAFQYQSSGVMIDYVYLDSEERRRFAQVGHEYLIEQVQTPGEQTVPQASAGTAAGTQSFTLNFNHPCKEFIWTHKLGAFSGAGGSSAGWFLGYSNRDEWMGGWELAVQTAARNLARSMIAVSATVSPSGDPWTSVSKVVETATFDAYADPLSTMNLVASPNTIIKFICVNTTALVSGNNQTVYILTNPITFGAINLASGLLDITVSLDYKDVAFYTVSAPSVTVSVTEHVLSLTNLSVPLTTSGPLTSFPFTDRRLAVNTNNDVHVVQPSNYGLDLQGNGNLVSDGNFVFNGHDRFAKREGSYFNYVQPYQHHTRTPADGVNVYSFALHPEQHQPTGTSNQSRIDNTKLNYRTLDSLRTNTAKYIGLNYTVDTVMWVFAVNYNVLRIMSGMGGIAYSN